MFFAKPGKYAPCGIFNFKHLILCIATIFGISYAVRHTKIKEKNDVKKIIRILTLIMWALEVIKIIYNIIVGNGHNMNKVIPLYYCSILLYAGLLSSICTGTLERIGNVFLATGGIVAGIVYIIFPTTSLPEYPMFHILTIHSFFFHGTMIYLGLIINKFNYIEIKKSDIKYYSLLVFIICVCAYVVNSFCGSNLMFISQDFPRTPITLIYRFTGKFFPIFMSVIQMTLPFYIVYWIRCAIGYTSKWLLQ